MKVLLAHPGTQYSHQLARQLEKNGVLYEFWTTFAIAENSFTYQLFSFLPRKVKSMISNRVINGIPVKKIKILPLLEFIRLRNTSAEQALYIRNKKFQQQIPDASIKASDVIIGFDTSSWILIERAKKFNKRFILDQSIAHPVSKQRVYRQIDSLYPGWHQQLQPKANHFLQLEQKEHEQADFIVVASTFTKGTLVENGVEEHKIMVNPYGVDTTLFHPNKTSKNEIVQVLYLGTLGARKGLPALLDLWSQINLKNARLILAGPCDAETLNLIPKHPNIDYVGKIPHKNLAEFLQKVDILVFPSFFEGFGLVILEAMASGIPVITTSATAGADIITNGIDGYVYEPFDIISLQKHLSILVMSTDKLEELGSNAFKTAVKFTWDAYGNRWAIILSSI